MDSFGMPAHSPTSSNISEWLINKYSGFYISVFPCVVRRLLGSPLAWLDKSIAYNIYNICITEVDVEPTSNNVKPISSYKRTVYKTHHDVYAVFNKIAINNKNTLVDLFNKAVDISHTGDDITVLIIDNNNKIVDNINFHDKLISLSEKHLYTSINEHLLSFNSTHKLSGKCSCCNGLGFIDTIDTNLIIKDKNTPLVSGGLSIPFDMKKQDYIYFSGLSNEIRGLLISEKQSISASWNEISQHIQNKILGAVLDNNHVILVL